MSLKITLVQKQDTRSTERAETLRASHIHRTNPRGPQETPGVVTPVMPPLGS